MKHYCHNACIWSSWFSITFLSCKYSVTITKEMQLTRENTGNINSLLAEKSHAKQGIFPALSS
jgi:hypothetical protein